jgi:putative colanic acid biosynthesis UDP-glucose lipid carrier transferase
MIKHFPTAFSAAYWTTKLMTQPILFKNSISIALLAVIEAAVSSAAAVASLYATAHLLHLQAESNGTPLLVATVIICLLLIRRPQDAGSQLSIQPLQAALLVLLRFAAAILILYALGTQTRIELVANRVYWIWAGVTAPALALLTLAISTVTQRALLAAANNRKAVFAGYNESSLALAERLERDPSLCLQASGFFDDRSPARLGLDSNTHLNGTLQELSAFVKKNNVDVIFISLPIRHLKRVMDLLDDLRDTTASIYYIPDVFVFDLIQARSTEISGIPVVAMCETPFYGYRGISKRLFDLLLSALALIILSPIFVLVALAVKLSSPGPIIFKQRRYGLDGSEIAVYKFRSMSVTEDGATIRQASKTDSRITPVGGFLRKSSLDELPQLINVLQGKMSLVGPRPHAIAHNEEYRKLIKGYMVRHKVPPGITGWAQVNGCRGETTRLEDMEARVTFDIEYLRHWSLWLDVKILFLTGFKIFRDKQAY